MSGAYDLVSVFFGDYEVGVVIEAGGQLFIPGSSLVTPV
ncbi:hypothetical protein DSUL_50204 [Desulfovibrionales bacterium]